MTDRPIIFSAPMILALDAGRKTMTRRIIYPQPRLRPPHEGRPDRWEWESKLKSGGAFSGYETSRLTEALIKAGALAYAVGDRLWVREAWRADVELDDHAPFRLDDGCSIFYDATGSWRDYWGIKGKRRASIHMPRWASRLTLTVTGVKVERLQDISEADAMAEGVEPLLVAPDGGSTPHIEGFLNLWERLYGPGAWEANPFVAVYTFTVEQKNIDA